MPNTRRRFLKQSGLLLAATALPLTARALTPPPRYAMGLQLFTIRDAMERDARGSLKQVAALGFRELETYGYDAGTGQIYGMDAAEFKSAIHDLGMVTSSGHYGLFEHFGQPEALKGYVDRCMEGAIAMGQKYITWPWMPPEARTPDHFRQLADTLNRVGEQVAAAGLGFAYHNHGFEFEGPEGGQGFDIILQNTDRDLVKLQLDWYWVAHSSAQRPAEWIARDPERFVMWHLKDMDPLSRDYTELGRGSIDYPGLLPKASQQGLEYYYLEQGGNFARDAMASIAESAAYFKEHLQQYLR